MKSKLHIDLETFSSVDIQKSGVYKHVESPDFEILLFAYRFNDEPVRCIDLTDGGKIPNRVILALNDPNITKKAWNVTFEILCLETHFERELEIDQWECTQIGAKMVGLPASLAQAGLALHLDTAKDSAGKALINFFCKPVAPKKSKLVSQQGKLFVEAPVRNTRLTHPDKWEAFINYCIQDVVQESKIDEKIAPDVAKAQTPEERYIWWVDFQINRYGVMVDQSFTRKCIAIAQVQKAKCMAEAIKLTKLKNPNSPVQIKGWLEAAIGESIESLNKKFIPGIKEKAMDAVTERVIELRQELAKSSVKKFDAILKAVCEDGRLRGLLNYYGAQKTGRWSSFIVQLHNLKQNKLANLAAAREVIYKHGIEELEAFFTEGVQDILSQLIRAAFISKPGHSLLRSDFAQIEARIIAWLACEEWRMKIFNTHGKIYEDSASRMFKVPIEKVTKDSDYRAKAKIAELALGFGGGVDALKRMGGEEMGLTETEMKSIVKAWRIASPKIKLYWKEIEDCALNAVRHRGKEVKHKSNVSFKVEGKILWLKLPSGRYIAYREPRIEERWVAKLEQFKDTLTYIGMEQTRQQITRLTTYGGKLVENIVQGTARDLLAGAMVRMHKAKINIALHVHDEVVPEIPDKSVASTVIKVNKIMTERPEWAKTLPIGVETKVSKFYQK